MICRDSLDFRLLNDFQRGFPLLPRPWEAVGERLGREGTEVLARLAVLRDEGKISRVGAVFAPNRIGASTLAAMAVPPERLAAVAAQVSAFAGVNHNYRREHRYNLWFVAGAADQPALVALLDEMGEATGCPPIALPLVQEYHIDLGFDLVSGARTRHMPAGAHPRRALSAVEWRLVETLQEGLPWVPRPFRTLGDAAGFSEQRVIATLGDWLADGTVRRFGVVVRHRELGWQANAMCVWTVPEGRVDVLGTALASHDGVSLCYRRRPDRDWPHNLFCMIHGRDREAVVRRRAELAEAVGLEGFPHAVLFSTDCYKQCGARYATPQGLAA